MSDTRNFPIDDVVIGERHRRDLGDLELLAESIREKGLLQPIGVTSDATLLFGYRRLLACRDLLGWTAIPARVVDDCSPVEGQLHENEPRENLIPSERSKLIDAAVGNRSPDRDCGKFLTKLMTVGGAAEKQGTSRSVHYRVMHVNRDGVPELVAAMDRGEISPDAAEVIAAQAPERQRAILALPARARREEVRHFGRSRRRR